jgi:transcriptional regulator with XRE-family HTH domain
MRTDRLKELRINKGIMQKDLAVLLGMSPARYNHYESGKREPDNEMLISLADYY